MNKIAIIGGGGHAKVVMDIILKNREIDNDIDMLGFYDDYVYKKRSMWPTCIRLYQ